MMKRSWFVFLPVLGLLLSQCAKDPLKDMTQEESRIYVTNYDTTVSFSNYKTFRIADSIAIINNDRLQGRERTAQAAQFIDAVTNALQQKGFTKVPSSQPADLGVTVSAITNTSTQLVSYRDYGNYYGSFWDPFYWDYPGFSYFVPTYYGVYETGETALTVDIVDLKNVSANNQLRVIWSGLIRGSGIFSGQSINEQINALFSQSTYLRSQ